MTVLCARWMIWSPNTAQQLQPNQLIKIDGKIMAIAFMANAQHLMYRKSVLEAAGIAPPKTYEDVVAAAVTLKEKGEIASPLVANFKPGWDLGEEFVNMYMGYGGEFFEAGSAAPAISGEAGMKALAMMKAMADTMAPEYMTFDTNSLGPVWEARRCGDAEHVGVARQRADRPGRSVAGGRGGYGSGGSPHRRRRHDSCDDPVVGWFRDCQEHQRRGCRSVVPGDDEGHRARRGRGQPDGSRLADCGL